MYRQSKTVGNNENVGWSKEGKECLYNIYMMEEIHTVLAAGGGAVTKLKNQSDGRIERIFNLFLAFPLFNISISNTLSYIFRAIKIAFQLYMTNFKKDFIYFFIIFKVCELLQFKDMHFGESNNKKTP